MILLETFELLQDKYKSYLESISIEKVQIGIFLTAVKLSDGNCGVSSTDLDSTINCCHKRKRDFGNFTPGNISGQNVMDLFKLSDGSKLLDSVKLAVLNAVSAEIISKSNIKTIDNIDPFDLLDLQGHKTISIVGAFQTYINKLANTNHKLNVLELNEDALSPEQKKILCSSNQSIHGSS